LRAGQVFGERRAWDWHQDAAGRTCADVSLDATGTLMQGAGGSKADGRMSVRGFCAASAPPAPAVSHPSAPPCGAKFKLTAPPAPDQT
jgi:hypothetical protein